MSHFPLSLKLSPDQNIFAVSCINESTDEHLDKKGAEPIAMRDAAKSAFSGMKTHRRALNTFTRRPVIAKLPATRKLFIFDAPSAMETKGI